MCLMAGASSALDQHRDGPLRVGHHHHARRQCVWLLHSGEPAAYVHEAHSAFQHQGGKLSVLFCIFSCLCFHVPFFRPLLLSYAPVFFLSLLMLRSVFYFCFPLCPSFYLSTYFIRPFVAPFSRFTDVIPIYLDVVFTCIYLFGSSHKYFGS